MAAPARVGPQPVEQATLPPGRIAGGGVRMLAGVPYAGLPGARPLEMDLWLPPAAGRAVPAVIFLHGGGWRLGSRHSAGPAYAGMSPNPFELVARSGIAVVSVDYRLSGEATFPAQLNDARAVVRWLRARADDIGVDPGRLAAWGESAGGHLAALLGLTAAQSVPDGAPWSAAAGEVSPVVAWYAPSDIATVATDIGADPQDATIREAQLLGAPVSSDPARAAAASPITYVTGHAPPFLLLHGRADRLISFRQSQRLHAALVAAGADAHLHLYDDADHMWFGSPEAAADAVCRTIAFLHHHLDTDGDNA